MSDDTPTRRKGETKAGPFVLDNRVNPVNLGSLAGVAMAAFWFIADLDKRVDANTLLIHSEVGAFKSRLDRMEARRALEMQQDLQRHEQLLAEIRALRSEKK